MARLRRNTITEVAERAGVSPTTVSHVLSGNRPVARATQERVQRAIAELGYRPSGLARSLRLQRSETIALIVPDIGNPFYTAFARGVDDALEGRYLTFVCNTDASRDRELRFAADLLDRQVDGMVLATFGLVSADLSDALDMGMSVVSLGSGLQDPRVDVVLTDDEQGAFEATRHLIERGHRRIGMIWAIAGAGEARLAGYRRALDESGIPFRRSITVTGGWNRSGGSQAMDSLLAGDQPPTAVFAANDLMAIGAMDAVRAAGRVVPDDVAIVGYDDIEAAALVSPALTTVVNPAYDAGIEAGRLLLARIADHRPNERREVRLPSRLVIRQST